MTLPPSVWLPPTPDIIGAIIVRLRNAPPLQPYIATKNVVRVSAGLSRAWVMPDYAIIMHESGGPPGNPSVGLIAQRIDLVFYGPGKSYATRARTANELYRVTDAYINPTPSMGIPGSFIAAHSRVHSVIRNSGPIPSTEPNTDWARVSAPYIFTYGSIPA